MGWSDAIAEQYSPPPAPPASRAGKLLASPQLAALLILAVAVATRIVAWWNPVPHVDDQFYLLAGQELIDGHWPYVDVWDRKPLGLFLIYAAIAWIGGGSMVALNFIATAFAAATAWVVRAIGLRFASPAGATLGALAYLFTIPLVGGQTGQSPVFYNLLMAGAGWLLIDGAADRSAPLTRRALTAMLLCGLAMTVKQISFIEGVYFGLSFLWLMHRRGMEPARITGAAAGMIMIALLPTALTLAGYALAGREPLDAFLFATVTSIFLKTGWGATAKIAGVAFFFLHLTPLLLMAIGGAVMRHGRAATPASPILLGWAVAALLGYMAVPHFFDHYALPVAVPLAISAATFFDRDGGWLFFLAVAFYSVIVSPPIRDIHKNRQSRIEYERLSAAVDRARDGGCLYIGDGPTRLYSTTGACRVTRYLLPDHLNLSIEQAAVGTDTGSELQAILARRPAVIVTQDRERARLRYSAAYRHFLAAVASRYRQTYATPHDAPQLVQDVRVWQRKDLAQN